MKVTKEQVEEVSRVRERFGLSLFQCCRYLEQEHGVEISRTGIDVRLKRLAA